MNAAILSYSYTLYFTLYYFRSIYMWEKKENRILPDHFKLILSLSMWAQEFSYPE